MIIASKKPKILASQINTGGAPVVLPPPTPQVFTMGGAAGSSSTTPIQTTNTPVTSAPVSGSSGSLNANAVSKSISGEAEKDIQYYIEKYWYVPVALVVFYIGNKKYRWV